MRLLIITQKVDSQDPILGFFHSWIEEFSKHFESIIVICLQKGTFDLPKNVEVFSLGKEKNVFKINYVLNFYKLIWQHRNEYDSVFVHMNPEYAILGGVLWKTLHKKIGLWYVHRQVNLKLRAAVLFSGFVFTSSIESFRLVSGKVHYLGHGINTKRFIQTPFNLAGKTLVYVGRITPIKKLEVFIEAISILEKKYPGQYSSRIIGDPIGLRDKEYHSKLHINSEKAVSQEKLPQVYSDSYALVNMSPTGGMDKTVLEAIISGRPAFASNQAFSILFKEYSNIFMFKEDSGESLSQKIEAFGKLENKQEILDNLARKIRLEYSIESLINKVSHIMQ